MISISGTRLVLTDVMESARAVIVIPDEMVPILKKHAGIE
jgi:hypothetical protein